MLIIGSIINVYSVNCEYISTEIGNAKLSSKKSNFDTRYIFTGWQIINKDFMKKFTKKKFSLKQVYDLAEKNNRLYGIVHTGLFFHVGDPKAYSIIKSFIGFKKIKIL